MAAPVVVIQKVVNNRPPTVLDGNGNIANGAYVYHLWGGISLNEAVETQDSPTGTGTSFQMESRELPRTLSMNIEIAEDLTVPTDGGAATFQTSTLKAQVAIIRGLRNSECNVTTRTFAFKGLLKAVQIDDDGEFDNAKIMAKLTFQIIVTGQFGLKTGPNGIILGSGGVSSAIVKFALVNFTPATPPASTSDATSTGTSTTVPAEVSVTGAGESGTTTTVPQVINENLPNFIDNSSFNTHGSGTMGAHIQVNRANAWFGTG